LNSKHPDGGYLLWKRSSWDFEVVKLDQNGAPQWERSYGGSQHDNIYWTALAPDGGYVLAGGSHSPPDGTKTSPRFGNVDYWIVKIDPEGNQLWDRSFGGASHDWISGLTVLEDGRILVFGNSHPTNSFTKTCALFVGLDQDGNTLFQHCFEDQGALSRAHGTPDGDYMLLMHREIANDPEYRNELVLNKINQEGRVLWQRVFGPYAASPGAPKFFVPSGQGNYLLVTVDIIRNPAGGFNDGETTIHLISTAFPPDLLVQPQGRLLSHGSGAVLEAEVFSLTSPLKYQWRKDGQDLPEAIGPKLELKNFVPGQEGDYSVVVANAFGSAESAPASVAYTEAATLALAAGGIQIFGVPGRTYRIESTGDLSNQQWDERASLTLDSSPATWTDASGNNEQIFYRALLVE
jgi:hypothetical protein